MSTELRDAIANAIGLWKMTLAVKLDFNHMMADAILALPELVELQRLAAIGRFVVDSRERQSWIASDDDNTRCKGWNAFRRAALAAGGSTPGRAD